MSKYHILMHIYRIYKNGTDEPICRAGIAMQTLRTDLWTQAGWEGEGGVNERATLTYIHYHG